MNSSFLRFALPFAVLAFVAPVSAVAQKGAGGGPTVIPGGPVSTTFVIDQPGCYMLGGNRLMTNSYDDAIVVAAPDVTLDLGGFALAQATGGAGLGSGIRIAATENIEIRNGSLVDFYSGVQASSGKGLRVIDVRVASPRGRGIVSEAEATLVTRCHVTDSGDYAISVTGYGSLVTDCVANPKTFGVSVANGARVVRTVVRGGTYGLIVGENSTATDCTITGASKFGIYASSHSTLRNLEALKNAVGITFMGGYSVFMAGSRITNNTVNVQNSYTNGGGNFIQ